MQITILVAYCYQNIEFNMHSRIMDIMISGPTCINKLIGLFAIVFTFLNYSLVIYNQNNNKAVPQDIIKLLNEASYSLNKTR